MGSAPTPIVARKNHKKLGHFFFTIDHFVGFFLKINGDSMVAI
jgi:hypothetical protein